MDKTVFVGLSGGVDSSVAAFRLKKQGYKVVGVFIKVWQPDFLNCNWEQERLDAMRVAASLDIPFLTCNAETAYKKEVGDYFIQEYQAGRTPNPDVMCNQHVKFGTFLDFALERGADYVATGHYAQVEPQGDNFKLSRGVDHNKDQTYFLWTLKQDQLKRILFPIGASKKMSVRQEAEQAGLPTATKKDSQGICFLGQVDVPKFIGHFVDLKKGLVLDTAGNIIGEHEGAIVYTLGQRHGFTINASSDHEKAHYVVKKDLEKNVLVVANQPPALDTDTTVKLKDLNWISEPNKNEKISAQFRYRQNPFAIDLFRNEDNTYTIKATTEVSKPASGQSCVLYSENECLGGGIIV